MSILLWLNKIHLDSCESARVVSARGLDAAESGCKAACIRGATSEENNESEAAAGDLRMSFCVRSRRTRLLARLDCA